MALLIFLPLCSLLFPTLSGGFRVNMEVTAIGACQNEKPKEADLNEMGLASCDPKIARCSGSENCDVLFTRLINFALSNKSVGTTDVDECPRFYSRESLDPVMKCYRHANSLNAAARSYLAPGEPDELLFDCSDGPEHQSCNGPSNFKFIRDTCCEHAGNFLPPRCTDKGSACQEWPRGSGACDADVDKSEEYKAAATDLKGICEMTADEHVRQFKWLGYQEFVESLRHQISRMPSESADQDLIHIMMLTSGGHDDMAKSDAFLWKSNLWILATAWEWLLSMENFKGVVIMDPSSDKKKFSECREQSHRQEALPRQFHTLLLTDVSYSAMEALDNARLAKLYGPVNQCSYVMGAAFTAGKHYEALKSLGCIIKSGYTRPSHVESLALSLVDRDTKFGPGLARWLEWWAASLVAMDELDMKVSEFHAKKLLTEIPDFVAQHKIPDRKSIPEVSPRIGGLHEILRLSLGLDKTMPWDSIRPERAPYKKI